jgi:predicted PurR-regulated permease PerM
VHRQWGRPVGISAGTILVAYVIAAVLWIALSDRVLAALVSDHGALVTFSTLKGWAFVAVTGAMLAAMLRRHDAQRTRQASEVEARDVRRARERALIAEALESLRPLDTAEQTAEAICRRIVELPEIAMASVLLLEPGGNAMPLALTVDDGRVLDRRNLGSERSSQLRTRAGQGPWVEAWRPRAGHPYLAEDLAIGLRGEAYSPIRSGANLIGLLTVGSREPSAVALLTERLPAILEFASLAGALLAPSVARTSATAATRGRYQAIINDRAFHPAMPIPLPPILRRPPPGGLRRSAQAFFALGALVFGVLLLDRVLLVVGTFSTIVLVFFLAWLLAFLVSPLVEVFTRRFRLPRTAAIALIYLLIATVLAALVLGIATIGASEVSDFLGRTSQTTARVSAALSSIQAALGIDAKVVDLSATFNHSLTTLIPQLEASLTTQIQPFAQATVAVVGNLFIVVILSLYMVAGSEGILRKVNRIVPNRYADELELSERTVARAFGGFLRTQVTLVAVQVALTTVVMLVFGLPYLFLTGIVTGLAMFIPFFGPPIALFPSILVAVAFRPEVLLPVAVILIGFQTVLVNYFQPRLMRHSVGMHPILVVVALLVGAQIAGLWGAIFGIPIAAVLAILVSYFIDLRAVAEVEGVDVEAVAADLLAKDPDSEVPPEEVAAIAADLAEATYAAQSDEAQAPTRASP